MVVRGIKSLIQSLTSGIDSSFGEMIAKNENENLKNKFNIYETLFFTITTIAFSCTYVLITPFVSVYVRGITDVNYVRYLFGYLIVVSEFIWAIRLPYSSLVLAAGHFKQTKVGAWIECVVNIFISLLLVFKFGIIGVAIGTIIAMSIRTIEFIIHTNKKILFRNYNLSIYKILLVVVETIIIIFVYSIIPKFTYNNYFNWGLNAFVIFVVSTFIVLFLNTIFYKQEMLSVKKIIKRRKIKNVKKSSSDY